MVKLGTVMSFAPFVIAFEGQIKVRILRNGILHRLGSLAVRMHPDHATSASTVAEPPASQSPPDAPAS